MLIILIGAKGSGKSYIGRILESSFGVHFFHVEPLWMDYYAECRSIGKTPVIAEGVKKIHPLIEKEIKKHNNICIETTGASTEILNDFLSFASEVEIFIVRVIAPLELCLNRIASRDQTHQIQIDTVYIREIYRLSESCEQEYDLLINNIDLQQEQLEALFRQTLTLSKD